MRRLHVSGHLGETERGPPQTLLDLLRKQQQGAVSCKRDREGDGGPAEQVLLPRPELTALCFPSLHDARASVSPPALLQLTLWSTVSVSGPHGL